MSNQSVDKSVSDSCLPEIALSLQNLSCQYLWPEQQVTASSKDTLVKVISIVQAVFQVEQHGLYNPSYVLF